LPQFGNFTHFFRNQTTSQLVERALEDGRGEAGLADYQVRGWTGWHHHMAMTLLANVVHSANDGQMGKKS
jgi:SRSO17 transposase